MFGERLPALTDNWKAARKYCSRPEKSFSEDQGKRCGAKCGDKRRKEEDVLKPPEGFVEELVRINKHLHTFGCLQGLIYFCMCE